MTRPDRFPVLYGAPQGHWALLDTSDGLVPPPRLSVGLHPAMVMELAYLGTPGDVVMGVYRRFVPIGDRAGSRQAQRGLGEMLGVTQQSVSRYLAGSTPALGDAGWRCLVRAHFSTGSLP